MTQGFNLLIAKNSRFYSPGFLSQDDCPQRSAIERPRERREKTTKNGNVARPPAHVCENTDGPVQKRHDRDIPDMPRAEY